MKSKSDKCDWRLHNDGQDFICMKHGVTFHRYRDGGVYPPDDYCEKQATKKLERKNDE